MARASILTRETPLDRGLSSLSTLNFPELQKLMKELGRPEAKAKHMDVMIEQLRTAMQQDQDRKIVHVFKVLEALESMERVDTSRIRALFLDGDIALESDSELANKEEVTHATRVILMNRVKDVLLYTGPDVFKQVCNALKAKQLGMRVGKVMMFTPDYETWHKGSLVSVNPLIAEVDGAEIVAKEACLEETFYAAEIKRVFRAGDADKDGTLSYDELTRVMRALGFVKSSAEMGKIFAAVDKDNSGFVDYEEFVDWVVHDSRSAEIENADWIDGIHAHAAEQPGDYVKLQCKNNGYEMHGPGVVILGKNPSDKGKEMCLVGMSVDCIDDEKALVSGITFDVHGHDFKVGFATARNRWHDDSELDVGVSFAQVKTPYENSNEIHIVDGGVPLKRCFGHFKEGGWTTVRLEINAEGKVEILQKDEPFFTSSSAVDLPIFVKVYAAYEGPLLQDLKWVAKSERKTRKNRRGTY